MVPLDSILELQSIENQGQQEKGVWLCWTIRANKSERLSRKANPFRRWVPMGMEEVWTTLWWMTTLFGPRGSTQTRVRPGHNVGNEPAKKKSTNANGLGPMGSSVR